VKNADVAERANFPISKKCRRKEIFPIGKKCRKGLYIGSFRSQHGRSCRIGLRARPIPTAIRRCWLKTFPHKKTKKGDCKK